MSDQNPGITSVSSHHSVDQTIEAITEILVAKRVTLFALVDHSGEAAKVGMTMPPTKLLIFGNPLAGTPVMLAAPSAALDLPLKLLVHEDNAGNVWITYNTTSYLQHRHEIPLDLLPNLAVIEAIAANAAR
jgi:uncharacterized protein (DUF302 family)